MLEGCISSRKKGARHKKTTYTLSSFRGTRREVSGLTPGCKSVLKSEDRTMRLNAVILGAGACCRKMLPGLRSAFDIRSIYDPNPSAVAWDLMLEEERAVFVGTEDLL